MTAGGHAPLLEKGGDAAGLVVQPAPRDDLLATADHERDRAGGTGSRTPQCALERQGFSPESIHRNHTLVGNDSCLVGEGIGHVPGAATGRIERQASRGGREIGGAGRTGSRGEIAGFLGDPQTRQIDAGWGVLAVAGFLVGIGTQYGSGCTSGHGVCVFFRNGKQ